MFKLSAIFCSLFFLAGSWMSDFSLPRLTHGPFDYFFMPLIGYLSIFLAAQLAVRLLPNRTDNR
jgi:hypothetical protein